MVQRGVSIGHTHFGDEGNLPGSSNLHKDVEIASHTPSYRQYDSSFICSENGGNQVCNNDTIGERSLVTPTSSGHFSNSRASPRRIEWQSRLEIKEFSGLQRVGPRTSGFLCNLPKVGETRYRSICFTPISSFAPVYGMETRPTCYSSRCTSAGVEKFLPVCVSAIFSHRQGIVESEARRGLHDFSHTTVANTTMVWTASANGNCRPSTLAPQARSSEECKGGNTSFVEEQVTSISGLENFRKILASEKISRQAAELITNSRAKGTNYNYQSAWKKWSGWCSQQQVDPFKCSLSFILNFLASLFEQGLEYSTINTHRSAISAYHEPIEGFAVGKHPRVCALTTGVFKVRPSRPRFVFIWDVEQVLNYLDSLPPFPQLSTMILVSKLAMLLALCSASRGV